MQDPKTKQVDSWDEEVVDVKPTQVDDWGEEVVDVPLKKNGANQTQVTQNQSVGTQESTTPLQQPTTPSATSTSESEPTAPVTGTPTPEGMQLQDVEIVAEKPNILEKARGAFNYGLESYVKDITDYDLLRSNAPAQRKIELLEQRRAEQLPIGDQDIIQQAAGMVGGTIKGLAKSVGAGILAAPATPLASVVAATGVAMGDGWKQGYTSSFKEAYYQAIDEGKTPEQAIEIAQNVGETGGVGGAVEGAFGAIPLTKGATTLIKPSSKLLKKGIEYVLDAAIDGSVAAGAQVATNIEAQREGLKRELSSGTKESFIGEAGFGLVSNAAHPVYKLISKHTIGRIATDKVKPEDRKDALTIAATQPIEAVNAAVTEAVAQGEITEARGVEITADVVKRKKALEAMPSNMSLDEKNDLADKIEQRQLLESELDKVDEATKPFVELQINQIDKSIPIPLPPKYMNTAGQNISELKDGQLYITRKGDVRMWDAAQKQFLEPPKSFEVEAKKETEQVKPTQDDSQNKSRVSSEVGKRQEPIEAKPIETRGNEAVIGGGDVQTQGQEVTAQPEVATEQPAVETVQAEAEVAPESQVKPLQTEAESQVETLPTAEIDQVEAEIGSKTYKQKLETYPKGRTREKTLPDGTKLKGTFKIVSADDVLASHNEQTFAKTEGFPTNEKGKTVNDRDYETDKAAQSEVVRIASNLDERAISQTPIVTKDGIVVDGNNRTMSRKLAAKQGTDKAYLDALKADADMYGIEPSEIDGVKNPMLVFEAEQKIPYTTKEFARFNKAEKKEKSPVEKAVELSKTISDRARRILGGIYEGAATPSEVTSNKKSMSEIRDLLISEGILQQNELPRYINPETGTATKEGVSFLETLLIGTSLDENTIRMLDNEGMGNAREKVLKAVVQITQNAALGENSLQSNIENGVKLLNKAKQSNQSVVDAVSQMDMFEVSAFTSEDLAVAILLDGSGFKDFLKRYNSEVGTESLFEGTLTKEKIIDTLLSQKIKNYEQVRKNLRADAKQGEGAVSKVDGGDSGKAEPNIFDQYDNTKGASKKDKVIEQYAKESGKDKADRVRDIIDNFDAIKSRLQELISEGKIDNIEIRC